ncbi:MAG: WD40 repeat domain-containing protein [Gemmataceae bacterium]
MKRAFRLGVVVFAGFALAFASAAPNLQPRERAQPDAEALPAGAVQRLGNVRFRPAVSIKLLDFSKDGKTLLLLDGGYLGRLDVATGFIERGLVVQAFSTALSPDGRLLARGHQGDADRLRVWDLRNGKELGPFVGHNNWVRGLAFSADSKFLVSGAYDQTIRLWEVASGKEVQCFAGEHIRNIMDLACAPDGKTLAVAANGPNGRYKVGLLDLATGKEVQQTLLHVPVFQVGFSPDGRTLLAVEPINGGKANSTIHLWDVAGWKHRALPDQAERVHRACFSPDSKLLATGSDHKTCLWDVATGKLLHNLGNSCNPSSSLAFSPDGKILASSNSRSVQLWDTATGQERTPVLNGHRHGVNALAFQKDGHTLASTGHDQTLRLWDTRTGKETRPAVQLTHETYVDYRFSADGKTLGWCSNNKAGQLFDVSNGKPKQAIPVPGTCLAFARDGRTLAIGGMRKSPLQTWDLAAHKQRQTFELDRYYDYVVALSPTARYLACLVEGPAETDDGMCLCLWDARQGQKLRQWPKGDDDPDFQFSPDGKLLAFHHQHTRMTLWEMAADTERLHFTVPKTTVVIAFAHHGKLLAVGTSDKEVLVYDLATGTELARFKGHRSGVRALAFAPDDRTLASGSYDTTILLWDVSSLRPGQTSAARPLTQADLDGLWDDLAAAGGPVVQKAIWSLIAAPQQAPDFFKKRIQPARPVDARRLEELITDLDDDRFQVREQASQELEKLAEAAAPALEKALEQNPAVEARRRMERLLGKLKSEVKLEGNALRALRAIEVLEHIGNESARKQLQAWAAAQPATRFGQAAERAWRRLDSQ